jgi:hypothetical protein
MKIKVNWHVFMENSSEAYALNDFCTGKSLNHISKYIWSDAAKFELNKARRLKMKSARIGAKRVINKYYQFD